MKIRLEIAFFLFAILIGARDVGAEFLLYKKAPEIKSCFTFLMCATITTISFIIILLQNGLPNLLKKISKPNLLPRIIILGISAAVVYLITFNIIGKIGAGKFDLFDYGLTPILTAILGVFIFGNTIRWRFWLSAFAYVIGITLLFKGSMIWLTLAILSPIGTAISDATTKWLLMPEGGSMNRSELLFVRFLPATILIGFWIIFTGGEIHFHEATTWLPLSIVGGFLPLWILCTALGRAALTKFAIWEFLIPVTAFLLTIPWHPEFLTSRNLFGAGLIILAVIIYEVKLTVFNKKNIPSG